MTITANIRTARLLAAGSLLSIAGAAMAQPPATPPATDSTAPAGTTTAEATDDSGDHLQVITVTAQRREENLQRVPISVETISAQAVTNRGAITAQTLAQTVPGLQFDRVPTASTPFMRGIGTPGSTIGNEPSIAFYLDDIYVPNGSASAFEFNNVSSVEVLRGPQGTLFGRNAVGGLINVRTRNPEHESAIDYSFGYSNFDTVRTQVYATTGLGSMAAANIAGYYTYQGQGWGRNVITGSPAYRQSSYGARAKLLIEPSPGLSFLLIGDHERSKGDIGIPGRVESGTVAGTSNLCVAQPKPGCVGSFYNPNLSGAGFYDVTGDVNSLGKRYFDQGALKIRYDFGPAVFQAISSYSYTKFWQIAQDNDNTPYALQSSHYPQWQKAFTQELQLASPSRSHIQWIVGAYYYWDNSTFDGINAFQGVRVGSQTAGIFGASHTKSYSGYGQVTAEILPGTDLTVGARYTKDNRDFATQGLFRGTTSPLFTDKHSWGAVTGRAAIDHRFTDDLMIYAAYNRGFKSGVYNLAGFPLGSNSVAGVSGVAFPVNPEKLDAFSAGFKSEFLDHRVRLNVEGFYYNYKNIQLFNVVPAGTELRNAAGAHVKGVDVDLQLVPVRHFNVTISGEVLDGHYTKFPAGQVYFTQPPNALIPLPANGCAAVGASPSVPPYPSGGTNPIIQRGCDLSGNETIQSPPWSLNIAASYDIQTDFGTVTLAGDFAHRARYYFEADNNYTSRQPATDTFNASIAWVHPNKMLELRVWGNNITNVKSYTYIAPSASVGVRYAPRSPRTYGVTLGAHF